MGVALVRPVYDRLRPLVWQYRYLRGHRAPERHLCFLALAAEVERLGRDGAGLGELHDVVYELLQER
jgi:hypothetical protein